MMELSGEVLDAIRNKSYRLKPVSRSSSRQEKEKKKKGESSIGEILARRLAMGYMMEEDRRSIR